MFISQALRRGLVLAGAIALSIVSGIILPSPAEAQIAGRQWELGFGLGSANLDSSGEDFDLDFRLDLRGGYFFTDRFELEGQWIQADAIFSASLEAYMVNAVFNFSPGQKTVPYVLVGAGTSELDDFGGFFGNRFDLSESAGAYQVALGSRFFFRSGGRMAFRLELSSLWIDTDLFDRDRHTSLTGGFIWAVGSR